MKIEHCMIETCIAVGVQAFGTQAKIWFGWLKIQDFDG